MGQNSAGEEAVLGAHGAVAAEAPCGFLSTLEGIWLDKALTLLHSELFGIVGEAYALYSPVHVEKNQIFQIF